MDNNGFKSVLSDRGYDITAKILVVGDVGVGKTNAILRYCNGVFESETLSTLGVDFRFKDIVVDEKRVRLQIWDTAGQERYRTITRSYYSGAMGIILIYSVTDRESFVNISTWMEELKEKTHPCASIILVSNKNDCKADDRKVGSREGEKLAERFNLKYYAASAKTGENINEIFTDLCRMIKEGFQDNYINVTGSRLLPVIEPKKKGCFC
jgi:Ras-related protein Rab-8A